MESVENHLVSFHLFTPCAFIFDPKVGHPLSHQQNSSRISS